MNISSKIKKGIRNPHEIPPYIRIKLAEIETRRRTFFLESQLSRLDSFRSQSEYLIVVLDACRFDLFEERFQDYFEGDLEAVQSVGYDTFQYVKGAWPDNHGVTYVSGATPIHSTKTGYDAEFDDELLKNWYDGYVPDEHISNIIDAWADGWDTSIGTCPPEAVTELALENQADQMVVHYFQPHAPYIGEQSEYGYTETKDARPFEGKPVDSLIWERVKSGKISDERLRELYASNLDRVLPEVSYLIEQLDFENVVVMSDHGEALGEFGQYAHPRRPHPYIRIVPWATIDDVTFEPPEERRSIQLSDGEEQNVTERLEELGYLK